jgi:hypothetical protein
MKALVLAPNKAEYDRFMRKMELDRRQYPFVKDVDKLYGYKDVIIFGVGAWYVVANEQMYSYINSHNIDLIGL